MMSTNKLTPPLEKLINALKNNVIYDYPVNDVTVLETHISYVILTGTYAYKIKKPLNLEFLDFSSLEKRLFHCQEEIRLNKRIASNLYLGIVNIVGSVDSPSLTDTDNEQIIEHAIKMHEFPQHAIFTNLLKNNQLTQPIMSQTATVLANLHAVAARGLANNPYGTFEQVHEPVVQNFDQINTLLKNKPETGDIQQLARWADLEHQRLQAVFQQRKENGFIRECHGDIHLGNIVLIDEKPVIFDCLEFNESLRWTDTMADLGFLAMDLEDKKHTALSNQLVAEYMINTGDYHGLAVLNYYKAYRAMVRAKIAMFRYTQEKSERAKDSCWQQFQDNIHLAMHYRQTKTPTLLITYGLTASGKSTLASAICHQHAAIQISSDVERKRLAGIDLTAQHHSALFEGIYAPDMTDRVYQHMLNLANIVINAGYPVIIDATFTQKKHRTLFANLANTLHVPFQILHVHTNEHQVAQWLIQRQKKLDTISEARLDILQALKAQQESLTEEEQSHTTVIDMSEDKAYIDSKLSTLKLQIETRHFDQLPVL